jgi:hypothetical protein
VDAAVDASKALASMSSAARRVSANVRPKQWNPMELR